MNLTIVKLGGSLLDLPDLPRRILLLLDQFDLNPSVIIVGGGATADHVRHWQHTHQFADEVAHDLAIEAMSFNARLLAAVDERLQRVDHFAELTGLPNQAVGVLNTAAAIRQLEATRPPLPRSWDVTSDSIAAWLAASCNCPRLLMLKSVELPHGMASSDLHSLTNAGLVDSCFPKFAASVPELLWCNLRASVPTLEKCLPGT